MFELKEVGRLYTGVNGPVLIVGAFDHPLDAERTAALHYYHASKHDKAIYRADTMAELRSQIELREFKTVKEGTLDEAVDEVFSQRAQSGEQEQVRYFIDPLTNKFKPAL